MLASSPAKNRFNFMAAKEAVSCLERAVAQSDLLHETLLLQRRTSSDDGDTLAIAGSSMEAIRQWDALLRGLRTLEVAAPMTSPLVGEVHAACVRLGLGTNGNGAMPVLSDRVITRAAGFLLRELEPLGRLEVGTIARLKLLLSTVLESDSMFGGFFLVSGKVVVVLG